jgi:hypothetical protein
LPSFINSRNQPRKLPDEEISPPPSLPGLFLSWLVKGAPIKSAQKSRYDYKPVDWDEKFIVSAGQRRGKKMRPIGLAAWSNSFRKIASKFTV